MFLKADNPLNPIDVGTTAPAESAQQAQRQTAELAASLRKLHVIETEKANLGSRQTKDNILTEVGIDTKMTTQDYADLAGQLQISFNRTSQSLRDLNNYTALSEKQVLEVISSNVTPGLQDMNTVRNLKAEILLRDECGAHQACKTDIRDKAEQSETLSGGLAFLLFLGTMAGGLTLVGVSRNGDRTILDWREQLKEEKQALLQGNGDKNQLSLPAPQTPAAEPVAIPVPRRKITLDL